MINIWMSIVTWTVNLLGLVLFCAHPDFRTVKFTRMRILMWVVLGVVYMGCSGLMLALHIPVAIIAAILLLGWALWRRLKNEEVFIEGMFRGLIWIGIVLTMEVCIMYYRLGRDAFFVPDFHDPILSLPLSYVILIGFA